MGALTIKGLLLVIAKAAVTIGISSIPAFFANFFPDLNPAIVERVWWPIIVLSLASAAVFYGLSQRWPPSSWIVAALLFVICIIDFAFLMAMVFGAITFSPAVAALLARLLLVAFFVALCGCLSTIISHLWDILVG